MVYTKGYINMKNEKYEFLYYYAKSALDDELQRFKNHEDKANKFISLLSIVIVGYTVIIKTYSDTFFPPSRFLEWLCLTLVSITFLALVSSWSKLFSSLNFIQMPRLPLDNEFIEKYKNQSLPTNQYTLSITCENALKFARKSVEKKSDLLMKAYEEIAFSAWLITISTIIMVITSYTN